LLDIPLLAGFYRSVSYLTNVLLLAPERFGMRLPDVTLET
jgi:hypothetical protein